MLLYIQINTVFLALVLKNMYKSRSRKQLKRNQTEENKAGRDTAMYGLNYVERQHSIITFTTTDVY